MTFENSRFGKVVKDYRIIKTDSLPENVYLMDELNGIVIQQTLMGNTFYSNFSVANNRLFSILRNELDYIEFEISSMRNEPTLISKNKPLDNSEIYEVKNFAPFTTQRAYLFRIQ